jgi:sulfur-carrier protein
MAYGRSHEQGKVRSLVPKGICHKRSALLAYAIGYLLCIVKDEKTMVTVLVFGLTLRDAVGETEFELEVSEPTTVRKLIESNQDRMGPLLQFLLNREVMIAVNKKVSAEDTVVKDGDIVKLSHQSRTSYDGTRDIPI